MTNEQLTAEVRHQLADDIRKEKLRILMRSEYADIAVEQEMQRQRGAIDAWACYMEAIAERRRENLEWSENFHNDERRR